MEYGGTAGGRDRCPPCEATKGQGGGEERGIGAELHNSEEKTCGPDDVGVDTSDS